MPKSPITLAKIDAELSALRLRFTITGEEITTAVDDREYRMINSKRASLARQIEDWEALRTFIKNT